MPLISRLAERSAMETPRKLLETPQSRRRYNVARKGERDSLKRRRIWAISSQASRWGEDGPTTRHGATHGVEGIV